MNVTSLEEVNVASTEKGTDEVNKGTNEESEDSDASIYISLLQPVIDYCGKRELDPIGEDQKVKIHLPRAGDRRPTSPGSTLFINDLSLSRSRPSLPSHMI